MRLYQRTFENSFSHLGLLLLLSLGVCCQMSHNSGKGVGVHDAGSAQRRLGPMGDEAAGKSCGRNCEWSLLET